MIRPRHSSGTPITPRRVARSCRRHVPARYLVVAREPGRRPAGHHGAGHALGQREDPAGLAGHADVGFLAVGAGRLVDAADRPGIALQQLGAAPQDPLQQRPQRELPGQVLGHGDQPGRAGGQTVLALRSRREHGACQRPSVVGRLLIRRPAAHPASAASAAWSEHRPVVTRPSRQAGQEPLILKACLEGLRRWRSAWSADAPGRGGKARGDEADPLRRRGRPRPGAPGGAPAPTGSAGQAPSVLYQVVVEILDIFRP